MIHEINRAFKNELLVSNIKTTKGKDDITFLITPGVKERNEVKEVAVSYEVKYDIDSQEVLVVDGVRFRADKLSQQEEKQIVSDIVRHLFVDSKKSLEKEHGISFDVQGFTISLPCSSWEENLSLQQVLEEKEKAQLQFTYFKKHQKTREKIIAFTRELSGSATTKSSYSFSVERFYEWLMEYHYEHYPKYDEEKINEYIIYLSKGQGLSSYYVNRSFVAILKYSNFIKKKIDREKAAKKDLPQLPKLTEVKPRSLEDERINLAENALKNRLEQAEWKLIDTPDMLVAGSVRDHWRNLLCFRLCLDCCLRISEVVGLDIEDVVVDAKTPYLKINGKGNKPRNVPLPKYLVAELKDYIKWRGECDYQIEIEKQTRHYNNQRPFNFGGEKKDLEDILTKNEQIKRESIHERYEEGLKELKELEEKPTKNKQERRALDVREGDIHFVLSGLGEELRQIRNASIKREVKKYFKAPNALFVSNRTKRVSISTIQKVFSEIGRKKNRDGTWTKGLYSVEAHELRHTGIKLMVDNNVSINKIQLITGHESSDMVLRYSKAGLDEAATAVEGMRKRK